MARDDDVDPVIDATEQLYGAPPEDFLSLRTELSTAASDAGDRDAAKAIRALRKPTLAASLVNRLVLADRSRTDSLQDLGERLRTAQDDLDATTMRELSLERRRLVGELAKAALELGGRGPGSTAVRDEVTNTLDAAVADPDVADRLGRLTKSEQWSGFGPATGPGLTLVRGGRDTRPRRDRKAAGAGGGKRRSVGSGADRGSAGSGADRTTKTAAASETGAKTRSAPKASSAERRRAQRAQAKAQEAFDSAERNLTDAESAEHELTERIRRLGDQLSALQSQLDDAKGTLAGTRRETKAARARRREARSALDRAERRTERGD